MGDTKAGKETGGLGDGVCNCRWGCLEGEQRPGEGRGWTVLRQRAEASNWRGVWDMRSGLPGLVDQAEGSTFACSDLGVVAGQLWPTGAMAESGRPVRDYHTNPGSNNGGLVWVVAGEVDKRSDLGCNLNTELTGFSDRVEMGEREREKSRMTTPEGEFTLFHCISGFVLVVEAVVKWGHTRLLWR